MAFIRDYMAESAGDPFFGKLLRRLKPPRALRKLTFGRAIKAAGRLARPALGLAAKIAPIALPGIGGLAARFPTVFRALKAARASRGALGFARTFFEEPETGMLEDFEELAGDPGRGGPPKKARPKRKGAAAGTRSKAKAKRKGRSVRKGPGALQKLGRGFAGALPGIGEQVGSLAEQLMKRGADVDELRALQAEGIDLGELAGAVAGGRKLRLPGMKARRSVNPANVKALRRSLRRVEGFEKLVKRVHRMFPRMKAASRASRGAAGHAVGCRCIACKRRAA